MAEILITGGAGQVGIELTARTWPEGMRVLAPSREALDIRNADSVRRYFADYEFAAVINPAAYTAVDKAESEPSEAFAVNCQGAAHLAEATRHAGIPLVHVSTDYVFDGSKDGYYREDDAIAPLGVYGASKAAGEQAVRAINPRSVIVRTAWVVSPHRGNFVKTMLRLGQTQSTLRVVADQIGCPTVANDLAAALAEVALRLIADKGAPCGTYHAVNGGETSWHGLAKAVFVRAQKHGRPAPAVQAIVTSDYPTPAKRPANSRLATGKLARDYDLRLRPWQDAVTETVDRLLAA